MNKIRLLLSTQTLKDSVVSFAGHIGSALINLIFFGLVTRKLGPELFGIFALCMTTAYLFKDFADIALDSALLRFIPGSKPLRQRHFLKTIFRLKLLYVLTVIILAFVFRHHLSVLVFTKPMKLLMVLISFWALSQSLLSFITTAFQARKNFAFAAQLITLVSFVRLQLLFILFVFNLVDVAALILISIAADIVTASIALTKLTLSFLRSQPPRSTTRQVLRFGLPMLATSVSGIMSDKLNVYITNYYTTPSEVGLLTAASRLFTPVQSIAGSLSRVFGSRQASFSTRGSATTYLLKSLSLCAILASGLIFTSVFAKTIILILFGQAFVPSAPVFQILTLGFGLFLLQIPLNSFILYYLSRSDLMAYLSVLQLILMLIFNLALIPAHGIIGAGIAFVLTILSSVIISLILTKYATNKSL